jgi:hypothetical protein
MLVCWDYLTAVLSTFLAAGLANKVGCCSILFSTSSRLEPKGVVQFDSRLER